MPRVPRRHARSRRRHAADPDDLRVACSRPMAGSGSRPTHGRPEQRGSSSPTLPPDPVPSCAGSSWSPPPRPTSASLLAASETDGWLYLVTLTGTTGARTELSDALAGLAARTRALTDVPLYAGFGISTPEQARAAADLTDGIVVGSRAVQVAEEGPERAPRLRELATQGSRRRQPALSDATVGASPAERPTEGLSAGSTGPSLEG